MKIPRSSIGLTVELRGNYLVGPTGIEPMTFTV